MIYLDNAATTLRKPPQVGEAMLAALPESERAALPPQLDITCHLCGRTWTVATRRTEEG